MLKNEKKGKIFENLGKNVQNIFFKKGRCLNRLNRIGPASNFTCVSYCKQPYIGNLSTEIKQKSIKHCKYYCKKT